MKNIPEKLFLSIAASSFFVGGPVYAEADVAMEPFFVALKKGMQMAEATSGGQPGEGAEMQRLVLQQAFEGYRIYFETNPDFPEWVEGSVYPHGNFGNNPDTRYMYARLNPHGVYRIWGKRNTATLAMLQVGKMGLQFVTGKPLTHFSLDDLALRADGAFEVIVSAERPAGYNGDWRQLPADADLIFLRNVMLDWDTERDPEVYIERLDRPDAAPLPMAPDTLRGKVASLTEYTTNAVSLLGQPNVVVKRPVVNGLEANSFSGAGGMAQQMYHWGRYDLDDEEALLVEGPSPSACSYWNFHALDARLTANDYMYRQTDLNSKTLSVDGDNRFRLVVSKRDPGVANWIDTSGHKTGFMQMRWVACAAGEVSVKKVKVDEARQHMPESTKLVTLEERNEALRNRTGALRRRLNR